MITMFHIYICTIYTKKRIKKASKFKIHRYSIGDRSIWNRNPESDKTVLQPYQSHYLKFMKFKIQEILMLLRVVIDRLVHGYFDGVRFDNRHRHVFLDRDRDRFLDGHWNMLLNRERDLLLHRHGHRLHHLHRHQFWNRMRYRILLRNTDWHRMRYTYLQDLRNWYP